MSVRSEERPIRLVVRDDDLRRRRLTVLVRLLLAIPHLVWLALWGFAAQVAAFVLWLAILIEGKAPANVHGFVAGYVRYATQVGAYVLLVADPYPAFRGAPGYPVDVEIAPPARQGRWSALFRLLLAIPALLLASVLVTSIGISFGGVALTAAFLAWFVILVRGRIPRGLRDLVDYGLGYFAQTAGYALLLTQRYPTSDPALAEPYAELPHHPIRLDVTDDLERSRLTVLFRALLVIPHLLWLTLWAIAVLGAVVVAWIVALVTGRVPLPLWRFVTAYVRYYVHVNAFLLLVGRRFPGFTGRSASYGIDVDVERAERARRWTVLFRLVLAVPALLLGSALGGALVLAGVLGWFFALVMGRMPEGLRNLGAMCLRYSAQSSAYLFLLTDRYPYASPLLRPPPEPEPVALAAERSL